jgi:hypothetical protein
MSTNTVQSSRLLPLFYPVWSKTETATGTTVYRKSSVLCHLPLAMFPEHLRNARAGRHAGGRGGRSTTNGTSCFSRADGRTRRHREPNSLGTNEQTRSKGSEGGRTAAVDHGQGKTRLSADNRQGDRPSRQVGDDLSFASFRHGRFAAAADADLTDAQLRVAARPWRR